ATIFVNPRQFDNADDLARYPRTEARDAEMLAAAGVDILFAPPPEVVYPDGFATTVSVGGLGARLDGAHRPGHFDGVTTVVAKLLTMCGAEMAFFGEKDWQQLQIVRRLVADLNIPVRITGCATLREPDGLAMSSRNRRLSDTARGRAPALYRALADAAGAMAGGADVAATLAVARAAIAGAGFDGVDYVALCGAEDLSPMDRL